VGLIVVLIILSLMFGGFQVGTKSGGAGVLAPLRIGAFVAVSGGSR
jgi:TRAP-type C4-dicarboxylate transport system permease large subunit